MLFGITNERLSDSESLCSPRSQAQLFRWWRLAVPSAAGRLSRLMVRLPVFQMSVRIILLWGTDAEQMFTKLLRLTGMGPSVGLRLLLCNNSSFQVWFKNDTRASPYARVDASGDMCTGDTSTRMRIGGGCPHSKGPSQLRITQTKRLVGKSSLKKKLRCSWPLSAARLQREGGRRQLSSAVW